jgi:glycosyltransferase involved in cell wall biosynthesis
LPEDWTLVLAGSQGYEAAETLAEIAASSCRDRIRITGYLSDEALAGWYARARIFAFPSFDEGFGIPLIEAMAAGVPIVTGNRAAPPEVVGDAALLVDPSSDDEIASALVRLAGDDGLGETLVGLGRTRAAGFTWATAVGRTLDVYRELLLGE